MSVIILLVPHFIDKYYTLPIMYFSPVWLEKQKIPKYLNPINFVLFFIQIQGLPDHYYHTLKFLVGHLKKVADHSEKNKVNNRLYNHLFGDW